MFPYFILNGLKEATQTWLTSNRTPDGTAVEGLGIFGSPTFAVGGELFWGDDRLDDAICWLRHGRLQP